MKLGRRLPRSFYDRAATAVGPELLGRIVVRELPDGTRLVGRLVEVEAYEPNDPSSHAFRGPTPRNEVMFGPPGHLYVYFTYGMHFCSNVVTRAQGVGSAVLLRGIEPLEGLETMAANRGLDDVRKLCSGPARFTQAFGIARAENGTDLVEGAGLYLLAGEPLPRGRIARSTRVGVDDGWKKRWRFFERGSAFVSPGRPSTGSRRS